MLVLTRKKDQVIKIGDKIEVTILEIKGDQVRIGINAPKDVTILRQEVYTEVQAENKAALSIDNIDLKVMTKIMQEKAK